MNNFPRLSILCRSAVAICALAFALGNAHAQTAVLTQPQYSSISSTNNTIQISRMPVTVGGTTQYIDVTLPLHLTVAANGTPSFTIVPQYNYTPNLIVNNFIPGTYVGPSNVNSGKSIIVVAGPSPLAGGGTAWTLTTNSSSSADTYPSTATWYVTSIANSPLASRLKAAGITSTAYAFGSGDSGSNPNSDWSTNSLMGFVQVGNSLSISSFSYQLACCNNDYSTPTDTITYTLQQ